MPPKTPRGRKSRKTPSRGRSPSVGRSPSPGPRSPSPAPRKAARAAPGTPWPLTLVYLFCVVACTAATAYIAQTYLFPAGSYSPDYVTAAIPSFFILMLVEGFVGYGHRSESGEYELADSLSSITSGAVQQATDLIGRSGAFGIVPYMYVYNNWGHPYFPLDSWASWLVTFVAIDFGYYWFHRMGHEVNWMWAGHVVHHSSEHYNLTTALRQSSWQPFTSWMFYVPAALVCPPQLYLFHKNWNTLYQFWIHTTCVRRLGPIEWVFSTPSHHRVHHDRRVHKNYGGTLIIWDRIFGTFLDEGEGLHNGEYEGIFADKGGKADERVVYGILNPVGSWSPLWVQLHHVDSMLTRVWKTKGLVGKWRTLWDGPGKRPAMLNRPSLPIVSDRVARLRYHSELSREACAYHIVAFTCHLLILVPTLVLRNRLSWCEQVQAVFVPLFAFYCQGAVLDSRSWAAPLEALRLCVWVLMGVCVYLENPFAFPEWLQCLTESVAAVHALLLLLLIAGRPLLKARPYTSKGSAVAQKEEEEE